jgi:hypothetical protein
MPLFVAGAVAAGALYAIKRLARASKPLRAGPWPGLTPRGALVLLLHALVLAALLEAVAALGLDVEAPTTLPYLVLATGGTVAILVLAEGITRTPGTGAAVCVAYLLPVALLSLIVPAAGPPPELMAPAILFDLSLWLRRDDLSRLADAWPTQARRQARLWRKRPDGARLISPPRASAAGAVFGLTLALLEPPTALLLGSRTTPLPGTEVLLLTVVAAAAGALAGFAATR